MNDETLVAVQAELSGAMIPWPDDYMDELSPPACLLLLRQVAMATLKAIAGGSVFLDEEPDEDSGVLGEILNGVGAAIAGATHACVALELLPPEAEQALELLGGGEPINPESG